MAWWIYMDMVMDMVDTAGCDRARVVDEEQA